MPLKLFIYLWCHWVLVALFWLSPVAKNWSCSSPRCTGFSSWWLLVVAQAQCAGVSVAAACRLGSCGLRALQRRFSSGAQAFCPETFGIFSDQGANPCPLPWQADPYPLSHQKRPYANINVIVFFILFLLLVFRNATNFYILILYSEILLG